MGLNNKYTLILGSQSPRRKELLSWTKIPYQVITADLDEKSEETDPISVACDIATQKAYEVWNKATHIESPFIISADTIVILGTKIYGKPRNKIEARVILSELSDETHEVVTAVTFLFKDKNGKICEHKFYDSTEVTFEAITSDLMELYIETGDSLDKAGAYGIQGPSLTFISKVNGSYSNVVGFPLDKVIAELKILFGDNWRMVFGQAN